MHEGGELGGSVKCRRHHSPVHPCMVVPLKTGEHIMASIKAVKVASQDFTVDVAALRDDVAKLSSSLSEFIRTQSATTTNAVVDAVDNARQKISDTASKAQDRVIPRSG
jgi:LytS/YehU family sensor histidine kinase